MEEIWKTHSKYPGYEVSSNGKVIKKRYMVENAGREDVLLYDDRYETYY